MKRITLLISIVLTTIFVNATEPNNEERTYLDALYEMLNPADAVDRSEEFYLINAVRPALKARQEMPWGKKVSERDFRHFVLPLRVNNEAIDNHRPIFYDELRDRVKNMSMTDAILEINHWCHEKATYQPSDGRTHSPLQTVSSAIGRCGEESTFTVAALRAMGIPARQVYTPRWAHTDDNHAWVEAWADGKWYFLGACEPEPVLNLGWFNSPASRGMLMHARVPGKNYNGPEEVLGRANGNTDINVTSNYAPVDTLTVCITDRNGNPVKDCRVTFRVYNYAEFYPVASKTTDQNGKASIVAGLGDILVWATDGTHFGLKKCHVGTDKTASVILEHNANSSLSFDLDVIPPRQGQNPAIVTEAQRKENDLRMIREDSIRNRYTATFFSKNNPTVIASSTMYSPMLFDILVKSRGNYPTIQEFLSSVPAADQQKALSLLASLSEKDLTDVKLPVLNDHITATDNGSPLFADYIMSPRIAYEELTPFRSEFLKRFTSSQAKAFRDDPTLWIQFVRDSIDASMDWYPAQVTMSPSAVMKHRATSPLSRNIFFVAGARSFGIPARIDPVTEKTQWADSNGNWHDAIFNSNTDNNPKAQSTLKLSYNPTRTVDDPKYYSHFTISAISNGEPQLLNYPDFIPLSDCFTKGQHLDNGQYMTVTGQRMADGSVLAHVDIFPIEGDQTRNLILREDLNGIQVIGSFDAETKYQPDADPTQRSLLSTTGRGYYVVGLIRPNHEPSNHLLRDLAAESAALEQWGRPIILLYDSEESASRMDMSLLPSLPSTVSFGIDTEGNIASQFSENLKINADELPAIIIADTFNRVVFLSQGYSIGLGQTISDTVKRLD